MNFAVFDSEGKEIEPSHYQIDFAKSKLILKDSLLKNTDSLTVQFQKYPEFLTKRYSQFNPNLIVNNTRNLNRMTQLGERNTENTITSFDGLNTSRSISRGITAGTNQNTVLDSQLDLQISGKISGGGKLASFHSRCQYPHSGKWLFSTPR